MERGKHTCLVAALVVGSFVLLGSYPPAMADTVRLDNGDVITGKLLKVSGGAIVVDTEHSKEVIIDAEHVVELKSDRVLTVEYGDGREVSGYVDVGPDGKIVVRETVEAAEAPGAAGEVVAVDLTEIEVIHEVTPYYRYVANIDFGLNIASGNSDAENINLAGLVAPSFGKNTISLDGQWNRGTANGDLAAANWRVNAQYQRDFWDRWFWLVFNSYEHDTLQDLDLRITAGSGLGYTFFEPDPTLLKVSLGPAFVSENFKPTKERNDPNDPDLVTGTRDMDRKFAALRWTLDFDQDLFTPDVSLYHSHKILVGLTESQFVILTAQGLKFDLIADFALKLEFQFDHNENPASSAKKDDFRYLVKLGYDFAGDENDWLH